MNVPEFRAHDPDIGAFISGIMTIHSSEGLDERGFSGSIRAEDHQSLTLVDMFTVMSFSIFESPLDIVTLCNSIIGLEDMDSSFHNRYFRLLALVSQNLTNGQAYEVENSNRALRILSTEFGLSVYTSENKSSGGEL